MSHEVGQENAPGARYTDQFPTERHLKDSDADTSHRFICLWRLSNSISPCKGQKQNSHTSVQAVDQKKEKGVS